MVRRMGDERVAGVAGQMRVRNRMNLITRLQGLEYLMANGALRLGQGLFGTVLIVPGPIGLFRRSAMEKVYGNYGFTLQDGHDGRMSGPFEGDTFAEDFDLSLAILCQGGRIVYEPEAISRTKAPDRHFALLNQRYRWTRGAMQVLRKFTRRVRQNPRVLRPRLLIWILFTYVPDLFLLPAIYMVGLGFTLLLLANGSDLLPLCGWFLAFLLLQSSAGAFFISVHNDDLALLKVLPFYGPYNGLVLNSAWLISVIDEIRGVRMRW